MMSRGTISKLAACLLNISEARNAQVVETIAKATVSVKESQDLASKTHQGSELACRSTVLNIFRDYDYNRSVLTIVAQLPVLQHCVYNACVHAYHNIDLSEQHGGHPRLGAVDLIPIYPLSSDVSLEECGNVANEIAKTLAKDVRGSSFFLFGTADHPKHRGLVQRRKEVGWFAGKHGVQYDKLQQDLGANPSTRYGLTGVGASPYVTNCNVTIATQDVQFGHQIAQCIRASTPGGLPGIQAMAFAHGGNVEIACNVESFLKEKSNTGECLENKSGTIFDHYSYTSAEVIENKVRTLASERGVDVIGTALIGFTPDQALNLAIKALRSEQSEYWKTRTDVRMM
ncbi:glutamate formimidoyltransferase-like [Amphiura filiformis]|uniref:glutamate formimidoyltransferase-like n=1 Tax=Amphiura filiformis TaxID=82378 RepID=UPI003B222A15